WPYISSQFLHETSRNDEKAARGGLAQRAPPWAPYYPAPQALIGPTASSSSASSPGRCGRSEPLADPSFKLPVETLQAMDEVASAFQKGDKEGFSSALERLELLEGTGVEESEALKARNSELLGAFCQQGDIQPARHLRLRALETELLHRFERIAASDAAAAERFVEDFPEPLCQVFKPLRAAREVVAAFGVASQRATKGAAAQPRTQASGDDAGLYKEATSQGSPRKAITPLQMKIPDAALSQAVLQLPSSCDGWERQWETSLEWHPGILYSALQALPQSR
ncbi:unnamed protein product, partial [Polarella glacialis]